MTEQDIRNIAIEAVAAAFEMQAKTDHQDHLFMQARRCRVVADNIRKAIKPAEDDYPQRIIATLREQVQTLTKERDEARAELGIYRSRLTEFVRQQFEEANK